MPRIIRKYEQPIDLFVIGVLADDDHPSSDGIGIDDDETGFCISNGYEEHGIMSLGWAYILTKEQMLTRVANMKEYTFYDYGDECAVFLPLFKGEIGVMAIDSKGNDLMTDDIDIEDFITHHVRDHVNVTLVVTNGAIMSEPLTLKEVESLLTHVNKPIPPALQMIREGIDPNSNEALKLEYPIQDDIWPSRWWNREVTEYVDLSG